MNAILVGSAVCVLAVVVVFEVVGEAFDAVELEAAVLVAAALVVAVLVLAG